MAFRVCECKIYSCEFAQRSQCHSVPNVLTELLKAHVPTQNGSSFRKVTLAPARLADLHTWDFVYTSLTVHVFKAPCSFSQMTTLKTGTTVPLLIVKGKQAQCLAGCFRTSGTASLLPGTSAHLRVRGRRAYERLGNPVQTVASDVHKR